MKQTTLRDIYQLRIDIVGIKPPIWRRILITNSVTLDVLHNIIQIVMGWENCHLHDFTTNKFRYGPADPYAEPDYQNESKVQIKKLLKKEKDSIFYTYDFGDFWKHKIILEKVLPFNFDSKTCVCIKGNRACPPEDIGGPLGYIHLIEELGNIKKKEQSDYEFFEPKLFDIAEVNNILTTF